LSKPLIDISSIVLGRIAARRLRRAAVPALVDAGDAKARGEDSKLVSRHAWAKTRALRPDIPAQEIAGADHYVPEEQPAAVASAVLDFWDSIQ